MKRSEKKGFTIVELVIVIAVIAILAAVLIPNLSKLVTNANETADTMLIKELNTALDLDLERHETMYDALVAVERAGFIVSRINASVAGNEILWDSVNDCFVYLKGNEIVYQANREETPVDRSKKYLYWRIYESLPTEQTYSIYLNNETYNAETSVTVGFDAGRNKNAFAVNYTGTGTAQKVILRTDGQNLTVNAGQDTVNHYGATRTLTVTAVATNDCYHEHGFVGTLASFASGKLVAYRGAQYHQTKDDIVAQLNGKTFDLDKAIFGQHYYQDGVCIICGAGGEPTVKNGLVDGYYYKDDELFTGIITDGDETFVFEAGKLVIAASVSERISDYTDYRLTYNIPDNAQYVTKEIVLKTSDTLDRYVGETSVMPGCATATNIVINSTNSRYQVKSIGVAYDKDFKGAIQYLAQNIGTATKAELLRYLREEYGFDESYYPRMTKSDDFQGYLASINIDSITSSNYEMVKNAETSYGTYLKEKYGVNNILALPWIARANYYDSFHGGWPDSNNKINGVFAGDCWCVNGSECVFDDPEMILLFFKHTYDNILFTGISSDQAKVELLLGDMYNVSGSVYTFGDSNWLESVSASYGLTVESLYKYSETNVMNVDGLLDRTNFYVFTASHQWLMTNMYQKITFVAPSYTIIVESVN